MTRRAAACTTDPRPSVCPPGVVPTLRATRLQKSTDRCRARSGLVTLKAKSPKGASALQLAATGVAVARAWRGRGARLAWPWEEGTARARRDRRGLRAGRLAPPQAILFVSGTLKHAKSTEIDSVNRVCAGWCACCVCLAL